MHTHTRLWNSNILALFDIPYIAYSFELVDASVPQIDVIRAAVLGKAVSLQKNPNLKAEKAFSGTQMTLFTEPIFTEH